MSRNIVNNKILIQAFFLEFFLFAALLLLFSRVFPSDGLIEGFLLLIMFIGYFFAIPLFCKGRDVGMLLLKLHLCKEDSSCIGPKIIIIRIILKLIFIILMVTISELVFFRVKKMTYDKILRLEMYEIN